MFARRHSWSRVFLRSAPVAGGGVGAEVYRASRRSASSTSSNQVDDLIEALRARSRKSQAAESAPRTPESSSAQTEVASASQRICDTCGKQFASDRALASHQRLLHGVRPVLAREKSPAPGQPTKASAAAAAPSAEAPSTENKATAPVDTAVGQPSEPAASTASASASSAQGLSTGNAAPTGRERNAVRAPIVPALQRTTQLHRECLAVLRQAEELLETNQKLRNVKSKFRWAPTEESNHFVDPVAPERRPFGGDATLGNDAPRLRSRTVCGAEQDSVARRQADAVPFVGGSSPARAVGVIYSEPRLGLLKFRNAMASPGHPPEAEELACEFVLRTEGYREAIHGGTMMMQNFFTVRLHGRHCVRGLKRGDVVDVTGVVGLHPLYDIDTSQWLDEYTLHVRSVSGALRLLDSVELPKPKPETRPLRDFHQ